MSVLLLRSSSHLGKSDQEVSSLGKDKTETGNRGGMRWRNLAIVCNKIHKEIKQHSLLHNMTRHIFRFINQR